MKNAFEKYFNSLGGKKIAVLGLGIQLIVGIILLIIIHLFIKDTIMMLKRDYFGYPQGIILQNFADLSVLMM